ncbi:MAG: hypothetical protein JSU72_02870 [Deltaproteobacteria bacterium]|nr:MAG: hypothetical protein JSU72_02870 [Deltaproteobacteria bacterium]
MLLSGKQDKLVVAGKQERNAERYYRSATAADTGYLALRVAVMKHGVKGKGVRGKG